MPQRQATILSAIETIPDTYLIRLEAPDIAAEARPGQFIMVRCGDETVLPRPLSIHRRTEEGISILFADVGKGTHWLSQRKRGERLDIFGPLGNGFTLYEQDLNLMLVAGGMGIAPLVFLAETAVRQKKTVTFICGARSRDCLMPVSMPQTLFEEGVSPKSMQVINVTEDGTEGTCGRSTDLIVPYLEHIDRIYACGPVPMYLSMAANRETYGVPVQLSLETVMGCGTGVCYGCTIRTNRGLQQVCKDGPVFDLRDIDWQIMRDNMTL